MQDFQKRFSSIIPTKKVSTANTDNTNNKSSDKRSSSSFFSKSGSKNRSPNINSLQIQSSSTLSNQGNNNVEGINSSIYFAAVDSDTNHESNNADATKPIENSSTVDSANSTALSDIKKVVSGKEEQTVVQKSVSPSNSVDQSRRQDSSSTTFTRWKAGSSKKAIENTKTQSLLATGGYRLSSEKIELIKTEIILLDVADKPKWITSWNGNFFGNPINKTQLLQSWNGSFFKAEKFDKFYAISVNSTNSKFGEIQPLLEQGFLKVQLEAEFGDITSAKNAPKIDFSEYTDHQVILHFDISQNTLAGLKDIIKIFEKSGLAQQLTLIVVGTFPDNKEPVIRKEDIQSYVGALDKEGKIKYPVILQTKEQDKSTVLANVIQQVNGIRVKSVDYTSVPRDLLLQINPDFAYYT